jgi:2',3'-cyclic-nucleotide 2'-phosphodiesterase (5'-nucleotidase family)
LKDRIFTILQLNDLHGYMEPHPELYWHGAQSVYKTAGGLARISSIFKEAREENRDGVITLDNGDTIHGTYPVVKSKGDALVPLLNELGFDAWTAHWDFAYTAPYLEDFKEKLNYPLLAINCYGDEKGKLFFEPYRVVERKGLSIGIIGIAAVIVDEVMPEGFSEGVHLTLGEDELRRWVEYLREIRGVDLIIVFSHLGYPQELKLLSRIDGIDVFLSGHTHNRVRYPKIVNGAMIIQSGCHGSFIGRIDLRIGSDGGKRFQHRLIDVNEDVIQDPVVQEMVDKAMEPHRGLLSEVVGETKTDLHRNLVMESPMDNLLLQALKDYTGAEMAFSNGWRYGAPIPRGPITRGELWQIIPVNPPLETCEITGEEVWDMMEMNLQRTFARDPYNQKGGYVKRCLGLNLYFKIENPEGKRINRLFINGKPVDMDKIYTACYVTRQGVRPGFGDNKETLDVNAIDVLEEYLEQGPVDAPLQNTIVPI